MNQTVLKKITEIREALEADLLDEEEKMVFGVKREVDGGEKPKLPRRQFGGSGKFRKRIKLRPSGGVTTAQRRQQKKQQKMQQMTSKLRARREAEKKKARTAAGKRRRAWAES